MSSNTSFLKSVQSLRLEAIFHPKFDNEKSSQQESSIRKSMKQKCTAGEGYLEVSVKHSGSLLLWSGGNRFYSKNSTDNLFTMVGDILLRQHFNRAHPDGKSAFQQCSDYLEANRITLSFENVTTFMGDHGDRPNRDFLMLTAVADRTTARFYSTAEAIAFAQRFRLPHNDYWVFQSPKAVEAIFDIYDETKETGTASTVLPILNQAADTYVASMHPHDVFQGDILEGLVVRFVPSTDTEQIGKLAEVAQDLLTNHVPITRPDGYELANDGLDAVNLRNLWKESDEPKQFETRVRELFSTKATTSVEKCSHSAVTELMTRLRESNDDSTETARIATVLSKLANLTRHAKFTIRNGRILIVHVIHDQTFKAFESKRQPGELPLFRGFSIELLQEETDANDMNVEMGEPFDEPLMLKMKYLPYMVRTFGCRNGLSTIRQGGPSAFIVYVQNLLDKWKTSQPSREKWLPFFRDWASYAALCFAGQTVEKAKGLRPLDSSNYLEHLLLLTKLHENGEFTASEEIGSDYKGLVVVVSPEKAQAQDMVKFVSAQLGGLESIPDYLNKPNVMDDALSFGRISSQQLSEGTKTLKKLAKTHPKKIAVVVYRCSDEDIEKLLLPLSKQKQLKGMVKGLSSISGVKMESFDSSDLCEPTQSGDMSIDGTTMVEASERLSGYISSLKQLFLVKETDVRPGALVFFAGIPGCGKSTCVKEIEPKLKEALGGRDVVNLEGDKIRKKYWGVVKSKRTEDPAVITIADKNSPPPIWSTVAEIASATKAVAIPVLPDQQALQTTTIQSVRYPDGTTNTSFSHHYPFSLQYLAVCMSRVMQREAGTHGGRLDCGTPRACMVVVKFYALYRNIKAEEFSGILSDRMMFANALMPPTPIHLPFFGTSVIVDLPEELSNVLKEAIECQCGYDQKKKETTKGSDSYVDGLEVRLRHCVEKYRSQIDGLAVDAAVSSESLVNEIVSSINSTSSVSMSGSVSKKDAVTLASIDVEQSLVHRVIEKKLDSPLFAAKITSICNERSLKEVLNDASLSLGARFVVNTHVTLVHVKEIGIGRLRSTFGPFVGENVEMIATSVYWNDRVMALEVEFASGTELETSLTTFPHITLWVAKEAQAFESKDLRVLWTEGKAEKLDFGSETFNLTGTVSLWPAKKSSFS